MPKRQTPDSDSDSDSEKASTSISDSDSEEVEETVNNRKQKKKGVSEYEKQRLSRIAENRARLEALGLPQIASSFKEKTIKTCKKGKEKVVDDDDEEYQPEDEEEPSSDSSSEQDDHLKDEDFAIQNASASRKKNVKNKGLKMKARVSGKNHDCKSEYIDDEDEALRQAIALSLQDSAEGSYAANIGKAEKNGNIHIQEDKGRKKNKKSFTSRLQMTEDELIGHFFQLDEAGKGTLTVRDLERAAIGHDFIWTDRELVDMIRCFDSDGDGKAIGDLLQLSFDDFRKIVVRCNMMKASENS